MSSQLPPEEFVPEPDPELESARAATSAATSAAADESASSDVIEGPVQLRRSHRSVAPSRLSLILVAVLAGSALFVGGFTLGTHVASTPGTPSAEEARFAGFWDVYSLIQSEYAGSPKPSQDELVQGAIKGMLEALNDQWSYYQAPDDFANSLQNVGGQAEGIGVQVQLQPVDPTNKTSCQTIGNGCELAVVKPIPGSPAEAAGVVAGDVISTVDGVSLDGKTIDQASTLIKGKVGTIVKIGLLRNGQPVTLTITRALFNQPEVAYKSLANGAVAYISISGVNAPAASQFDATLQQALGAGQKNVILDLRGNLGGYVDSAEQIASEFISSGTLAYQQDANGTTTAVDASAGGRATDSSIKVVVLVDGNTASAAEIISGALQARGRAVLIGSKTYGKGVVQAWLPLPNDFGGIHLTIAKWLTPDKVWINGKGLQPDVPIDSSKARAGTDPVLDAGLAQLGFPAESSASAAPGGSPSPSSPTPAASPAASPTPAASPS
jgi:carboxyl-terminal processing protease